MLVKDAFLQRVLDGRDVLLLDGGFGALMQMHGLAVPGKSGDRLCVEKPDEIAALHALYVRAGAQAITTNTFNTNALTLEKEACPYSVEEIYRAAAQCARKAGARYVAGDIGPLGELLEPYGELEEDEALALFVRNVKAAEAAQCDVLVIETMMDLGEAQLALKAARERSDLPVFVTMTFNEQGRTLFGVTPEQAAETLVAGGASAVGLNCSVGPVEMLPLVARFAAALENTGVALIAQPNAGLPKVVEGQTSYDVTPDAFADAMKAVLRAGANVVGGCCGTTPDHIAALKRALSS